MKFENLRDSQLFCTYLKTYQVRSHLRGQSRVIWIYLLEFIGWAWSKRLHLILVYHHSAAMMLGEVLGPLTLRTFIVKTHILLVSTFPVVTGWNEITTLGDSIPGVAPCGNLIPVKLSGGHGASLLVGKVRCVVCCSYCHHYWEEKDMLVYLWKVPFLRWPNAWLKMAQHSEDA